MALAIKPKSRLVSRIFGDGPPIGRGPRGPCSKRKSKSQLNLLTRRSVERTRSTLMGWLLP